MPKKRQDPVWLEVALNGAAGKAFQPGIPVSPKEIIQQGIACAKAGAAIVHLHVYDEHQQPVEDADLYIEVIEGIRADCDVIVYPTLGLTGDIETRYAPIKELAERGLMEWGVVDPGSVNISHSSQVAAGIDGLLYPNPDAHIRAGLEFAAADGWKPAYAIYEPGFARLGAAMAATVANLQTPIYRIMFSDNLLFGTPPTTAALEFYASHLQQVAPGAPWMISGLDADISEIMPAALELGAHVRVGLEDAPFGCAKTNLQLVESAVSTIQRCGSSLVSANEIRAINK